MGRGVPLKTVLSWLSLKPPAYFTEVPPNDKFLATATSWNSPSEMPKGSSTFTTWVRGSRGIHPVAWNPKVEVCLLRPLPAIACHGILLWNLWHGCGTWLWYQSQPSLWQLVTLNAGGLGGIPDSLPNSLFSKTCPVHQPHISIMILTSLKLMRVYYIQCMYAYSYYDSMSYHIAYYYIILWHVLSTYGVLTQITSNRVPSYEIKPYHGIISSTIMVYYIPSPTLTEYYDNVSYFALYDLYIINYVAL